MTSPEDNHLLEKDLYDIMGVVCTASTKEIKTAFRKKALECHPDKNPDDPGAAKKFHELTKILEILIDDSARASYDKVLNARLAAKVRNDALDSRRKKFKEELEERERQFARESTTFTTYKDENMANLMDRLREESSRQVQLEIEMVRKLLSQRRGVPTEGEPESPKQFRLKIKWSPKLEPCYDQQKLESVFNKYGSVTAIVISPKKKGSAIIEFSDARAAMNAFNLERGLPSCPLTLSWVGSPPTVAASNNSNYNHIPKADAVSSDDFEEQVLKRLREAQEKKRQAASNGDQGLQV